MKPKPSLLLHPLFILGLLILLLNDCWLKYEFHSWFTGKLSDITGLFVFSVFLFVVFPKQNRKAILIAVALFFTWWKSPASNVAINFINHYLNIPFHRVVDYSDLYCLAVLPITIFINPVYLPYTFWRKLATGTIGIIAFTAFTATSLPRRLTYDNKVLLDKNVKTRKKEDEIIRTFESNDLGPIKKEPVFEEMWGKDFYLRAKANDSVMIPVDSIYEDVYQRIDDNAGYTIPKMYVANDSIYDLQFIISNYGTRKSNIRLYSFQYKNLQNDSNYNSLVGYDAWKKFRKPVKKKIKAILNQ